MKRCMYCGHENDDASENCVKCGNHLLETPPQTPGVTFEDDTADELGDAAQDIPAGDMPENVAEPSEGDAYTFANPDPYAQYGEDIPQYGGQEYGYTGQQDVQQQYGGQAYGYDEDMQQYGQDAYYDRTQAAGASVLMKKARKRMHNPFLFLGILFYTLHLVAEVLNYVLGNALVNVSTVTHFIVTRIPEQKEVISLLNSAVASINNVNRMYLLIGCLVSLLPVFLLVLGLWIAFANTTNKKQQISTAGYTLSRVAIVLKLICVCAVFLAGIVFLVIFVVSAGAASHMMSLIGGVIALLVLVLAAVLVLLYYVQVLYGIKVVRTNVKEGIDIGRIPGYAILVGFVGCAATVLTMIPMAPDDYIGLAAKGTYAAWLLLSSFWALIYRATVKNKQ